MDVALSPWALGILGLLVGSFLNVVVHRLPLMQERRWWSDVAAHLGDGESHQRTFGKPAASRCPKCGHQIRWFENIPVVSWLMLRGQCSACKTSISVRYPVVELLTGLLFAAVGWRHGATWHALMWCAVVAVLLALAAIDWDTTLLPDDLTLPLMWAGLVAAAAGGTIPMGVAVAGAAAGYLVLWGVFWLFKLATGKEGMGYGDFKLLAALGAWLGWQAILPVLLFASVLGTVVGVAMKMTGALREGRYVPFGPFLAGGGVAVMLVGLPQVLSWMGWA